MKGYIYIAGRGADPARRDDLNDPIFGSIPTLGACMPNIRRNVELGDFIFFVSGKTKSVQQYVIGGMQVAEKISAIAAYSRYPENRISRDVNGVLRGNIIVNADGSRNNLDEHDVQSFNRRVQNYIVGTKPLVLTTEEEVRRGREETLGQLSQVLQRPRANRVIDLMGRWKRLDEGQVEDIAEWLRGIKGTDE